MGTIDKIYELILKDNSINTFNNNEELFKHFFYHDMDLIYGDSKVMDIFKYILSLNLDDENEDYPYINSRIFNAFNIYEQKVTQSVYSKGEFNDDYVELLYKLMDDYYFLYEYKDNSSLYPLYNEDKLIRDCTGAMMILLNSSFFTISNENIKRMMGTIKNNKHLQKIIDSGSSGKELLDKEYIFDYTHRFLYNSYFYNEDSLESDDLLTAFKEGKIKDKETIKKILNSTDITFLLGTFSNKLSLIIDLIEKSFTDELERNNNIKKIIRKIFDDHDYDILFKFIMNDSRYINYIDDETKIEVLDSYPFSEGNVLTYDEILFLIKNRPNKVLFINLKEQMKHNDIDEKTKILINKLTENIVDYDLTTNQALMVFDALFKNDPDVDLELLIAAVKRFVKDYLKDESVSIYTVFKDEYSYGTAFSEINTINLNVVYLANILKQKNKDDNPESLYILDTAFHEARHIIQCKEMENEDTDSFFYTQFKEDLLRALCMGYYKENYYGVSFEKDARVHGAQSLYDLLSNNYPYMKKSIDYYKDLEQKELNSNDEELKTIFELSDKVSVDDALDKIISINPSIIEKHILLKREYNEKGLRIQRSDDKVK